MKKILFLAIIFILTLCFFIKNGGKKMEYNNVKHYNELVTYTYSTEELFKIQNEIRNQSNINLTEVVESRNIECIRNVENTRYVLLVSENGEKLFIFFDDKNIVKGFYFVEDFLKQNEFEDVQVGNTKLSEIIEMDNNYFISPFSALEATIHIVKEGVIIIRYNRMQGSTILQDPIVKNIEFYDNDEILKQREKNILIKVAPYILPIDKY